MRIPSIGSPARVATVVVGCQLMIALPFLVISPSTVRGVPGPLLIVISMAASYRLGLRFGLPLTVFGVGLAVLVINENPVASPLVWIPASAAAALVGDAARRGERLRRQLITELRAGLVALSRDRVVGPVTVISRYLPAEQEQLLAGDFYGVVAGPGGEVALMVGDVSGHGPDAAAVATHLRAGWRALAVAGVPPTETLRVLNDAVLAEQRASGGTRFATVCLATVSHDLATLTLAISGHPPPLLVRSGAIAEVEVSPGPPLGVVAAFEWRAVSVALPLQTWSLLLYTDGLVEGRAEPGGERPFGVARLARLLADVAPPLLEPQIDRLLAEIRVANGGPMNDDVVMLVVSPAEERRSDQPAAVSHRSDTS
jgi:hypothetical protein